MSKEESANKDVVKVATEQGGKKGKPVFERGKHDIKIKVVSEKNITEQNAFTHDETAFRTFSDVFAGTAHPFELKESNDPQDLEEFSPRCYKMFCLLMAKKLSSSFDPQTAIQYKGIMSRVASLEIYAPTALVSVVEGLGYVEEGDYNWTLVGQPAWAITYMGRALAGEEEECLGVEQEINSRTDYFVNNSHSRPFDSLMELAKGIINSWAQTAPAYAVTLGNVQMQIKPPPVNSGFGAYRAFVQNAPKTIAVNTAIGIAEAIEVLNNLRPNGKAAAADIPGFNALGVKIIDWRTEDIGMKAGQYFTRVQFRLQGALSRAFTWGPIGGMKTTGSAWQLVRRVNYGLGTAPIQLPGSALENGWMMGSANVTYHMSHSPFVIRGEGGQNEKMIAYVEGMMRGRKVQKE